MQLNKFMSQLAPPPQPEPEKPMPEADAFSELPDDAIPEGHRNTTMSQIAGRLIKRYGNTDEAKKLFVEKAKACDPPLSRDELTSIWKSAVKFGKLDEIIQHLYEDNLEGKISDDRFMKLSGIYEAEQKALDSRTAELRNIIAAEKDANSRVESFLTLVRKYTDVTELNVEVIREFVERIYVRQAAIIDGRRVQNIKIVWNFIGEFTLPMTEQKEKTA